MIFTNSVAAHHSQRDRDSNPRATTSRPQSGDANHSAIPSAIKALTRGSNANLQPVSTLARGDCKGKGNVNLYNA